MAVPARPVSGNPIDSAWGQVAHDAAVALDIQSGQVDVPMTNVAQAQVIVTFPRPFAAAPTVVVSQMVGSQATFGVTSTPTPTTVPIVAIGRAGTAITVTHRFAWIAIGPRA